MLTEYQLREQFYKLLLYFIKLDSRIGLKQQKKVVGLEQQKKV